MWLTVDLRDQFHDRTSRTSMREPYPMAIPEQHKNPGNPPAVPKQGENLEIMELAKL